MFYLVFCRVLWFFTWFFVAFCGVLPRLLDVVQGFLMSFVVF